MKKLVLLLLVVGFSVSHAQIKGKITYQYSILKDSLRPLDSMKPLTPVKMDMYETLMEAKPIDTYLVFNEKKSLYTVEPRPNIPTWHHSLEGNHVERENLDINKIFAGGDAKYYRDLEDNFSIRQMDLQGKTLRLLKPAPSDWELKDSTKVILGYNCKYAVSKSSKLKVWYAEGIPLGHGPQNFSNLPGMVLEVYKSRLGKFIATKIEFDYYEANEIIEPIEGKLITVDELREMTGNPFGKKD